MARFITFEGGEGAGKSSHIARLAAALTGAGREVLCVREPGSSVVGEAIRRVLLDPAYASMADRTEILLYEAARAQVVEEIIRPALDRGVTVLADRVPGLRARPRHRLRPRAERPGRRWCGA